MLERLLSQGSGDLRTSSELRASQLRPVPELNVVLSATDDEYLKYLAA
jgi:hypothetical protein